VIRRHKVVPFILRNWIQILVPGFREAIGRVNPMTKSLEDVLHMGCAFLVEPYELAEELVRYWREESGEHYVPLAQGKYTTIL